MYQCFLFSLLFQGTRKIRGLTFDTHFLKEDRAKWNDFGPHGESWSKKRKRYPFAFFSSLSMGIATKTSNEVVLEVDAFARMSNLQLLEISNVRPCGNYEKFPKGLRWLCWSGFPLQMMPDDFPLDRLIALEMPYSCLKKIWNGAKVCLLFPSPYFLFLLFYILIFLIKLLTLSLFFCFTAPYIIENP